MNFPADDVQPDCLVLYKNYPARVTTSGNKVTIELETGDVIKVRQKDVLVLHPGPFVGFTELTHPTGDISIAWELILEEDTTEECFDLSELAGLIYGKYTPATAWATWQVLDEGVYFQGTIDEITPRSRDEVAEILQARNEKAAEARAWESFTQRVQNETFLLEEDEPFLEDIACAALRKRDHSRVLQTLGKEDTPESAHALLLSLGYWDSTFNPYPIRFGVPTNPPSLTSDVFPEEDRIDLTHLPAFAIDDQDNQDPDDAISIDGNWLWVHIADVSASIVPNSEIDLDARERGATLYLPEGMVPMLPLSTVKNYGLGLQDVSPALSFGIQINPSGELTDFKIVISRVRVQRKTYEEVEDILDSEPFKTLCGITEQFQNKRMISGALFIDLPEARIKVINGKVDIRPLLTLQSRTIVQEAMLMAGEAAGRFAIDNKIPFPYAGQSAPDLSRIPEELVMIEPGSDNLAEHYAFRRLLSRSQVRGHPTPHAGIGLSVYSRVTSPLRRYMDLVAHQQLRAFITGKPGLSEKEMLERIGISEATIRNVIQAENTSKRHWTLVYLQQNPKWKGEAVLVDQQYSRGWVIVPELGFEGQIYLKDSPMLNSKFMVRARHIDLPNLNITFEKV